MKKYYFEPTIELKRFEAENIVTASAELTVTDADPSITDGNAAITLKYQEGFTFVF